MNYISVKDLCKVSENDKPNGGRVNKLDDRLDCLSKDLRARRKPEFKKQLIDEFDLEFSDLIPSYFSSNDWYIQYRKHQGNKDLDVVICKLLDYTQAPFSDWWDMYKHGINIKDAKLRLLMIKKMKSIKDEILWTEVYQDLKKKKEIEGNPLMDAVKDMEALFGPAYYDDTDDDYQIIETIDYLGNFIEPESGYEDY